jgi:type VI secretion system protein ImpC
LRLSAQLRAVLHHPDFQRLEAAWRGLHFLVSRSEPCPDLRIRVLCCTKRELLEDQKRAGEFDRSALFQKVYEEPYRTPCGTPFGLLVGDFEFDHHSDGLTLLRPLSSVAAAAHAPFIAAASPRLFDLKRFTELAGRRDLARIFDSVVYAQWKSFRESEDARFVGLTLPRILGRLPYGPNFRIAERFAFDEAVDGASHDKYLWMNAAWAYAACVTRAFAQHGWFAATRGVENGGKVEGLPVHTFPTDDGEVAMKCPTEIAIDERHEYELSNLGFLPLLHRKNSDFAVFMGSASCQKPRLYDTPEETASAELSSKINLILCVSRFAHYLRVMARDKIDLLTKEVEDCSNWLNHWIRGYVIAGPEAAGPEVRARKPLGVGHVQIQKVASPPAHYQIVASLRPLYQLDLPPFTLMRLVAEVPGDAAFRPAPIDRAWLGWNGGTVAKLAQAIRQGRLFGDLPILADALQEAGCADERLLGHCREGCAPTRGCWVLDALLAEV